MILGEIITASYDKVLIGSHGELSNQYLTRGKDYTIVFINNIMPNSFTIMDNNDRRHHFKNDKYYSLFTQSVKPKKSSEKLKFMFG